MTETEILKMENEQRRRRLAAAYRNIFSSEEGLMVLRDIEMFCGQNASSVRDVPIDPYKVCYLEGARRVWLRINALMNMKFDYEENSNA